MDAADTAAAPGPCAHREAPRDALCPACALAAAFGAPLARFGRYEILEDLGRGGMGRVCLAHHEPSGRIVALKTPGRDGSADALRRFRSEAEAVAALEHPGIIPIYEVGEEDGMPFFTMKFAEGGSLAGCMGDDFDPRRAAQLVARVAGAVHHAHARGILHRDLKPENILLDDQGNAYVSDFGISRWLGRDGGLTQTGAFLGSPNYMAPEQIAAAPKDLTVAADVFSLGAILYHLLCGDPPFRADSLAGTLRRLGEGDLRPLPASVPRDLAAVCLHALEADPSARYASAQAFADDLRAWLDGRGVSVRPPGAVRRLWRLARRNPVLAVLSAVAAAAVLGGGTVSLVSYRRALRAETARADAAETLARDRLRSNLIAEARTLRLSGRPGQRTNALAKLREAWAIAPSVEIRNEAVAALALPDLAPPVAANPPAAPDADPPAQLSPDRRTVIIRSSDGAAPAVFTLLHPVTALAWTPDREQLVLGSADKHIWVWDRRTRRLARRLTGRESVSRQLAVSHRGGFVADVTAEGVLHIWQLASGQDLISAPFDADTETPLRWAPDDSAVFFRQSGSSDWRRTGIVLPSAYRQLEPEEGEAAFEDARTIDLDSAAARAAVTTEHRVAVWNLATGEILGAWPKQGDEWALARFVGDSLLIGGWSSDVLLAPASAPAEARTLRRMPGAFLVDVSRDGSLAGFVDSTDGEFEMLAAPFDGPSVHVPQDKPYELAISPDSRWIALSSYGTKNVRVLRWPDLRPLATIDADGAGPHLAVSPRGDRLYLASASGGSQWDTRTWKRERRIVLDEAQQSAMYLPAGGLLAIETRQSIRLHDPGTGSEVVRLPVSGDPRARAGASFTVSRDGRTLAVQTSAGGILLWNLPALRSQLAGLGMDW